ncbi:1-deoxy-D-xylulose-5-phosphate reductoisomerase, partial [Bacteroidota bacterium]
MKKSIAILGSTGSIGTQTLEVIREHPQKFKVEVLTANSNFNLLIKQSQEFRPKAVVIANKKHYNEVFNALKGLNIDVYTGEKAISQIVELDTINIVLVALVGYSGLLPTISAIKSGKNIALANKETLVIAGDMITNLAKEYKVNIIPVDSEHSAVFQCLLGENYGHIEKIILTASGGPFRGKSKEELVCVSKEAALNHPNWDMGDKITIDSASLMNKGLEVIEAKWLFEIDPQ